MLFRSYRSFNNGESWQPLSPDLTNGGRKGDVAYGTITTLDESKIRFGLIYCGTDDGNIQITKDGGINWQKISASLPQNLWCSRVCASGFKESRVYIALNGYRWDDMNSYLFASEDYGVTWTRIGTDLPYEPVNVVKEDPANENIIYAGTDNGLYISFNKGKNFMAFNNGLPRVAVHDLAIQPRDKEIIAGTHGRSIYVADVSLIQQLTDTIVSKDIYAFEMDDKRWSNRWGSKRNIYSDADTPSVTIPFYVNANGKISIRIKSEKSLLITLTDEAEKGLNFFNYDLSFDEKVLSQYLNEINSTKKEGEEKTEIKKADNGKYYLAPGKYVVELVTATGKTIETGFEIKSPEKHSRGQERTEKEVD